MALYIDSALLDDVERICDVYSVAGVTTNPSLLLAAVERGQRLDDMQVLRRLLSAVAGHVFMQPVGTSSEELFNAGLRYASVDPTRVVLKLPMSRPGLQASKRLRERHVRFAFTAVMTPSQAYAGASAGAEWVIPYMGRLRSAGIDACARISAIRATLAESSRSTAILAASIKSCADLVEATASGARDITLVPDVFDTLLDDSLTQAALTRFDADWASMQSLLRGDDAR